MSNIKIAICSVLKPINDARMYEKFGISIAETGKYEVHIIGYPATNTIHPLITFHPLKQFRRISIYRMLASWKIFKILLKVKPELIIVNTHELLIVALLNKILFGTKILYDIQENYFKNIWHQNNFSPLIKHLLALIVRLNETIVAPFLTCKILAEESYLKELPFVKKKSVIILNKYNPIRKSDPTFVKIKNTDEKWRFLYTGTVSKIYGIENALSFFKSIKKVKSCTLIIIGHCTDPQLFNLLVEESKKDPDIKLDISESPIDHEKIVSIYPLTDFALTPYPFNPSTVSRMPVKYYEYVAHKIPIIAPDYNLSWINFLRTYNAGIFIDFNDFKAKETVELLEKQEFYNLSVRYDVFWESERNKLLNILANGVI